MAQTIDMYHAWRALESVFKAAEYCANAGALETAVELIGIAKNELAPKLYTALIAEDVRQNKERDRVSSEK